MPKAKAEKSLTDRTTEELIDIIYKLKLEVNDLRRSADWRRETDRINESLEKAAKDWNSVTLMGHAYIVNYGYNFYIKSGTIHYEIRIKETEVQRDDIVMVFGRIASHNAHDESDRERGSMGVDTIVIEPDRILVISNKDNKIILQHSEQDKY